MTCSFCHGSGSFFPAEAYAPEPCECGVDPTTAFDLYDKAVQARIAQPGPRCRARCHGIPCELPEGHTGHHVTTSDGGFGWWHPSHSDPPTYWDKLLENDL